MSVRGRADRARWFDDYVELIIERDVLELTRVHQRRQLPLLLRQLAGQTAQVLNVANAARAVGMERSTAESYTKLLETVFLVYQLPAWGTTLGPRVGAAPKVHVVDSGLAARLLRLTEDKLGASTASALTEFGHLLETFVVGEVCKQLDWLDEPVARGHWRTHDGDEVDLVLEREDGKIAALGVKAASRVTARELRSLLKLRSKLGPSSWEASCSIPARGHTPRTGSRSCRSADSGVPVYIPVWVRARDDLPRDPPAVDVGEVVEHREVDEILERDPQALGFLVDRLGGKALEPHCHHTLVAVFMDHLHSTARGR